MITAFFLKLTLMTEAGYDTTYTRMPDAKTCVTQAQLRQYNGVGENLEAECVVLEVVENLDAEDEFPATEALSAEEQEKYL